ncbi:MAG: pantoate--beta-alanine ligase [Chthonomonas sp.]|nr:pantoate--beta-alanine ligase [Chthonomonas sp.]
MSELRSAIAGCKSIGLVPTMGALHEGHLELMRRARDENELVVVSLFVNPTQFGPNEDFTKYPRQEGVDVSLAESVGVDIIFAPPVEEVYPLRLVTISVAEITSLFEGAVRPGHFAGVATVVGKLFHMCQPHRAYFGLKDLQQCAVIQAMVTDLWLPIELKFVEIVRESHGLARSSRNEYLNPEDRQKAGAIYATLVDCAAAIQRTKSSSIELEKARIKLTSQGFGVDYLELVNPDSMQPIDQPDEKSRLIVCARLGGVRLLDNISCAITN